MYNARDIVSRNLFNVSEAENWNDFRTPLSISVFNSHYQSLWRLECCFACGGNMMCYEILVCENLFFESERFV